ncbi:hypothetical protein [Streptomyces sp. NPDC047928]|uniref:AbiJ-related protein n=1 Tax=unclassified Streptomyces TaxID=2593676 RepID=UPI0037247454
MHEARPLRTGLRSAHRGIEQLGAFEAGDAWFARFAEASVAGDVLLDETIQRRLTATMNVHLRTAGLELRETGTVGGYPRFALVSVQLAHARTPKNISFATSSKPDIRFLSAVDNDIEVVNGDVLIYDRTVTDDGIRWRDLQSWWQGREHLADAGEAKKSLYARLLASLPATDGPPAARPREPPRRCRRVPGGAFLLARRTPRHPLWQEALRLPPDRRRGRDPRTASAVIRRALPRMSEEAEGPGFGGAAVGCGRQEESGKEGTFRRGSGPPSDDGHDVRAEAPCGSP